MEPEGSLRCSQGPVTRSYPEPELVHCISLQPILILCFHLCLYLSTGFFPSRFSTKVLHVFLFYPTRATYPAHYILLDLIALKVFGETHKLQSSLLLLRLFFSPSSCSSVPLRSKYSPQSHAIAYPPTTIFPYGYRQSFTLMQDQQVKI
jgi:hypothetical protein